MAVVEVIVIVSAQQPTENGSVERIEQSPRKSNVTMARLAERLSNRLGEPVVDETGETGFFDFTLTWSPENTNAWPGNSPTGADSSGPSMFTALEEQLGLKLVRHKVPVDIFVIDSAARAWLD